MAQWKVGDLVQLKSGGPALTVNGFSSGNNVVVYWYVDTDFKEAKFHPEALQAYTEAKGEAETEDEGEPAKEQVRFRPL